MSKLSDTELDALMAESPEFMRDIIRDGAQRTPENTGDGAEPDKDAGAKSRKRRKS